MGGHNCVLLVFTNGANVRLRLVVNIAAPVIPSTPSVPKTGDNAPVGLFLSLMLMSGAVLVSRRKKEKV